jgi:hypothetical protein
MNTDPVAVSIVLSDSVICEQGTQKNSLIGCFNNFNFPQFPFPTPMFFITAAVTNLSPTTKAFDVAARIEDPTNGMVLRSVGAHIELQEPINLTKEAILEFPMPVMPFLVPKPGNYEVIILINNIQAGKRLLSVYPVTGPAKPMQ